MTTHSFQPDHYFTTMGSHAPVLHIAPGDVVLTSCVDAHGVDAHLHEVAPRDNPMTGPFYVEGAEPGDTLVVRLERITPNRAFGWSGRVLAANVVDPAYVPQLPWPADGKKRYAEWLVDEAAGTATLTQPETALGRLALPLAPMLGCFGVAPAGGEAIATLTSAQHGGNMDYRGFAAGVTAYFPVFVPGALFFLGDGHAVQGDGEIACTGIEISCDVQFSVDVQKRRAIRWPRGENADYIFVAGNARPLDQALQHATTEMARWLQTEYGLDPLATSVLMGQTVEYDLGNVYDPAYTMVCKMAKRYLPTA